MMSLIRVTFSIEGMNCKNCVSKIESAVNDEYKDVNLEFSLDQKKIIYQGDSSVSPLSLKKTIESCGFQVVKMEL